MDVCIHNGHRHVNPRLAVSELLGGKALIGSILAQTYRERATTGRLELINWQIHAFTYAIRTNHSATLFRFSDIAKQKTLGYKEVIDATAGATKWTTAANFPTLTAS